MRRRAFLGVGAGAGLALFGAFSQSGDATPRTRGFFFAPSDAPPRDVEVSLGRALPSWDVTVFGKARDLEMAIEQWSYDVVVAPRPTLDSLGLGITLEGRLSGASTEPYSLVSIGSRVAPGELAGQTVGMLGLMGRRDMKTLCDSILQNGAARLKTVTKYRDLLPLLQFRAARAVILPKRFTHVLTERSELDLVARDLPQGRVGVCSASFRDEQHEPALRAVGASVLSQLGVDAWV